MATKPVEVNPVVAPTRLSASSTLTFQQCPAKFYFSKIAKLPDPPSAESALGNLVHECLEGLYRLPADERNLDAAKALLRQQWERKWKFEVSKLKMTEDEQRQWRWRAFWCVEKLFVMEDPTQREFQGLETRVSGKVGDTDFLGFIDRYHDTGDGLVVGDYKTGKFDARFLDDKIFQMAVYAILGEQTLDRPVTRAELVFVKVGEVFSLETDQKVRDDAIKLVSEVVADLDSSAKTGVFHTNKTRLCDWCSFKGSCPAWKQ